MSPEIENEVLAGVELSRRGFVKKVVLGTAFAVPLISSFQMRTLDASAADCISPNQTAVVSDAKYTVQLLDTEAHTKNLKLKLRVRRAGTNQNVSSAARRVRLRSISPSPSGGPSLPVDFKFKNTAADGKHYELKLDTSTWANDVYELKYTVAKDPTKFSVAMFVGGC